MEAPSRPDYMFPTTRAEVQALGWDYIDIIFFTGDAFVDIVKLRYAQPAFASHMSRRGFGTHEPFSSWRG